GLHVATVSKDGLFSGSEAADPIAVEGYTAKPGEEMHSRMDHVGPRYFSTLGIPILMGREIEAQDTAVSVRAAVINQTFARRFFPNSNPIGKHVRDTYSGNPAEMVVVGVAADAKYNNLREKPLPRSEERRVGKECTYRGTQRHKPKEMHDARTIRITPKKHR